LISSPSEQSKSRIELCYKGIQQIDLLWESEYFTRGASEQIIVLNLEGNKVSQISALA
jgi:hypothetical protein